MAELPFAVPYLESSIFISWIKGERTQGPNRDADAKLICDSIIKSAMAGAFQICTSSLTIAEVHKKKDFEELTERESLDLAPYFRESYILLIELDREIAEMANYLCRTHRAGNGVRALRPNDAVHIASALRSRCDALLTWDPGLACQRVAGLRIEYPTPVEL